MEQVGPLPIARDGLLDFSELLALDEIGPDLFRNRRNQANVFHSIFGGSTIAQALAAADRTVEDRSVHSMHAYFLRSGVAEKPVEFAVERVRDGGRFSARRVVASQDSVTILSAECSYKTSIEGFSHQRPSSIMFDPENAIAPAALIDSAPDAIKPYLNIFQRSLPLDVRIGSERGFIAKGDAARHYWLRAPSAAAFHDAAAQRQVLAFMSDFMLAGVPLSPHTIALPGDHTFVASIDHALWFHRPVRCDDWLLFETESPNAEGGVNLARGLVYDRAGKLVASIVQEALQFPRTAKK